MSVINRRNAMLGWLAWSFAKQAAKRKAKQSVRVDEGHRRGKLIAPAAIAAAVGGAVFFWRRLSDDGDDES